MTDYSSVTEIPGVSVTPEAASMLYSRYAFAASFCHEKEVLEVGCGCGMGLGYLARNARIVMGGDFTEALLRRAHSHYEDRVPLVRLDAQTLPFRDASFDIVILFEAIYYLVRPRDFFNECSRVLRPEGALLICLPNREWEGFNPSPHSTRYFSASEIRELLSSFGFDADIFGAFRANPRTFGRKVVAAVRKIAVRWRLIPRSMRGKEFLKRLFYGQLVKLAEEVEDRMAAMEPPTPVSAHGRVSEFKVLYALGRPVFSASPLPLQSGVSPSYVHRR